MSGAGGRGSRGRPVRSRRYDRLALLDPGEFERVVADYYRRRGYQPTGVFKPFPYGDERFGIPLRDDLRFEVLEKPLQGAAPAGRPAPEYAR